MILMLFDLNLESLKESAEMALQSDAEIMIMVLFATKNPWQDLLWFVLIA